MKGLKNLSIESILAIPAAAIVIIGKALMSSKDSEEKEKIYESDIPDFTSYEYWMEELDSMTEERIFEAIRKENREYYHYNLKEAKQYLAEMNSSNHKSALWHNY